MISNGKKDINRDTEATKECFRNAGNASVFLWVYSGKANFANDLTFSLLFSRRLKLLVRFDHNFIDLGRNT